MNEPVRLVIWDLDETFWRGTLVEGGIELVPESLAIVRELNRRGIMSAICSKNSLDQVRPRLEQAGTWEEFIFPSIDWTPKGPRIARQVERIQLRPASVLFIDDNPLNLNEALHFVPDLQTAGPALIPGMLDDPRFKGKPDPDLKRLEQY